MTDMSNGVYEVLRQDTRPRAWLHTSTLTVQFARFVSRFCEAKRQSVAEPLRFDDVFWLHPCCMDCPRLAAARGAIASSELTVADAHMNANQSSGLCSGRR